MLAIPAVQGVPAVLFGIGLFLLFLLLAGVMLLQEAKFDPATEAPEYILNDTVKFVGRLVDPSVRKRIGHSGIQRVLEWQVYFLQDLARRDKDAPIVLGDTGGIADFIAEQLRNDGHDFLVADIRSCLDLQGEYLLSAGAVGQAVSGDLGILATELEGEEDVQDSTT